MAVQWWEHFASYQRGPLGWNPVSTPYVGWFCCWFSPLLHTRLSLRGGGWGFPPATMSKIPSCLIPRLLVVFILQLEILVTLPCPQVFFLETPVSPLSSKTNNGKFHFNQESGRWRTTNCNMDVLPLNHYLLLYVFYTCRFNMKSVLVCTCISHVINPLESNQEQKEQLLLILSTNCSCWQLGSKPMGGRELLGV